MTEVIKNYEKETARSNEHGGCQLSDSEKSILTALNTGLNLQLDPATQQSVEGLNVILLALLKKERPVNLLHQEFKISLRSLGIICLKLRGLYGYPHDPFGAFGINRKYFTS